MRTQFLLLVILSVSMVAVAQGRPSNGMGSGMGSRQQMGQMQGMGPGSQMGQWGTGSDRQMGRGAMGAGNMGQWQGMNGQRRMDPTRSQGRDMSRNNNSRNNRYDHSNHRHQRH